MENGRKIISLLSEINQRFPQLMDSISHNTKEVAIRKLMKKYKFDEKEFDDLWIQELERVVEPLRILPNQQ